MYITKFTSSLRFSGKSENTIKAYESDLRIIERETGVSLVDIQPIDLLDYFMNLKLESSTINRKVDSVHCYFDFLMKMKVITFNPSEGIEAPKEEEKEVRYTPSKDDIAKMVSAATNIRLRTLIIFLSETGMRFDEMSNIKLEQLSDIITIKGKGGKTRKVPISPIAQMAIKQYMQIRKDGATLFTSNSGTKLDNSAVYKSIRTLAKKSGVDNWDKCEPHMFRRYAVTEAHRKGMSISMIEKIFGHSFAVEKKNYIKFTEEELLSAVQ